MPTYDFRCDEHGYDERVCRIAERKEQQCSTCHQPMTQVVLTAPTLDSISMANHGFPGAEMKQGNDMYRRHTRADQRHRIGTNDKGEYMDQ